MTEAEWLVSSDPQAMLQFVRMAGMDGLQTWAVADQNMLRFKVSDRKLRLWACGCVRQVWHLLTDAMRVKVVLAEQEPFHQAALHVHPEYLSQDAITEYTRSVGRERCLNFACNWLGSINALEVAEQAPAWIQQLVPLPAQADLLRCIFGNPYRPVTLWPSRCPRCDSPDPARHPAMQWEGEVQPCHDDWHNHTRCPWLTPLVVSLAQAAYDERPGRKCEACRGDGYLGRKADEDEYACAGCGRAAGRYGHYSELSKKLECPRCVPCHGTGRVEDGRVEPGRLAVLADALEEAGVPDVICEECPKLEKAKITPDGYYDRDMVSEVIKWGERKRSCRCGGSGKTSHPLLAHLRSPGPHVRGCYAVDLCLGKS